MLSQRPKENRIIMKEEWSVVLNNEETLYEIKYCKCILRYWWDKKIKETVKDQGKLLLEMIVNKEHMESLSKWKVQNKL